MRIYSGAERRRRMGSWALVILGSVPFLLWLVPKIVRASVGGPLLISRPGFFDLFVVSLGALVLWNLYRVRSKPFYYADVDQSARVVRVVVKGRVARTIGFADAGPVRMSEEWPQIAVQGGSSKFHRTRRGSPSYVVDLASLPDYDIYESTDQPRARRRMEQVAREMGLGSVMLGGAERKADEIDLSLVERVRRRGEIVSPPLRPPLTPISVRTEGNRIEIGSSHKAPGPLALAALLPVVWAASAMPLWPILQSELRAEDFAPWVARGALVLSAVPILIAMARQIRAGALHGRIAITPTGVRYRFARAPLAAVEEIAEGRGGAARLWTDRGPIVISDGFCPAEQYGYLAQTLRWAVVEMAGRPVPPAA